MKTRREALLAGASAIAAGTAVAVIGLPASAEERPSIHKPAPIAPQSDAEIIALEKEYLAEGLRYEWLLEDDRVRRCNARRGEFITTDFDAYDRCQDRMFSLEARMAEMPVFTAEGVAVKVRRMGGYRSIYGLVKYGDYHKIFLETTFDALSRLTA